MTYDAENRPLSVVHAGVTTAYEYGADGSRLKMTVTDGPSTEVTLYVGDVQIQNYGQGSAEDVTRHLTDDIREVNGTQSVLICDHLGSIIFIARDNGARARRMAYAPYGEILDEDVYVASVPAETKGFIGERYDSDAGLQYLNARYYDPALGIFIQPDWFEVTELGVGTNRYMYSGGDPVNQLDPNGNSWVEDIWDSFGGPGSFKATFGRKTVSTLDSLGKGIELADPVGQIGYLTGTNAYLEVYGGVRDSGMSAGDAYNAFRSGDYGAAGLAALGVAVELHPGARKGKKSLEILEEIFCRSSFHGSTLVLTENGFARIDSPVLGLNVLAMDEITGELGYRRVVAQHLSDYSEIITVTIRDVETGEEQSIRSNTTHPYFAKRAVGTPLQASSDGHVYQGPIEWGQWVDAAELVAGDMLLNPDETWAEVVAVSSEAAPITAYNLTVEGLHTYFVAQAAKDQAVWVHNCIRITSRLKESGILVREAERAAKDATVQRDLNELMRKLASGHKDPGSGSEPIGAGISEARTRGGARLYYRETAEGIEVLGKSSKANQSRVIREVQRLFGR